MADNNNNLSQGFGWDDEVEESEFELLPDGDYKFKVTGFERAWFNGSAKIAPCNQANVELTIEWVNDKGMQRTSKLVHRMKLTKSLGFIIYAFFESIGLRKKGDGTTKMPWDQIIDKTGVCMIGHHDDDKGNSYNDIVKCYPAESAPTVTKNVPPEPAAPKFSL